MLLALTAIPLFAQPGQGQGPGQGRQMTQEDVKERVGRLTESLGCSDVQKKKILDFELQQYNKGQTERQKFAGDREAMREYMQKQRKLRDEKYTEILTEDQMKKYIQIQEERRQQRQGQSPGQDSQRGRGRR